MDSRTAAIAAPDLLLRKYRELFEKHERLLQRLEGQAHDRILVSKLSRATLRSRSSAFALFERRSLIAANPAWRIFDTPSILRTWSDAKDPSRTFPTLAEAALEVALLSSPEAPVRPSDVFVRTADGFRIRLRAEHIEREPSDEGGVRREVEKDGSILATAIEDPGPASRLHRVRNHLAAAMLHARMLVEESDAGSPVARRAAALAELVRLASEALDSDPHGAP